MRILIFAPHSAIWIHAFPEALIADALKSEGHEIVYVTCGRMFHSFCVPMSANRLSAESSQDLRSKVCKDCEANDQLLRREFDFTGPRLSEVLTDQDIQEVGATIGSLRKEGVSTLQIESIPLGRIALYQLLLRAKKFDLDFSEQEWHEYQIELRHTLYAFKATGRLIDTYKPDRVVVYNGLYSVNRAACLLAESRGIPAYFLHAGGNLANRLQALMIGRDNTFSYMARLLGAWSRFSSIASKPSNLSAVTDHFLEQLRGQSIFVYSRKKSYQLFDARASFGVKAGQKLLVAAMSSNDEDMAGVMVGAQPPRHGGLFPTQIEWIQALAEFVRGRPDLFLIIRVHPREFPNRRDGKKSQHAHMLEQALSDLPPNAIVNWPDEGVSLYDLAGQTDVFLNAWSSVGKDMPLLGIPVVTYSTKFQWYPADLNYVGESKETYFAAIDQALKDGWNFENARRAYRWAAFEFITSTVPIGDSYPAVENADRSLFERAMGRVRRTIDPDHSKRKDVRRRRKKLGAARQISDLLESADATLIDQVRPKQSDVKAFDCETKALRSELKRLALALFPDPLSRSGSRLYGALRGQDE
jgi:hypothetical protein